VASPSTRLRLTSPTGRDFAANLRSQAGEFALELLNPALLHLQRRDRHARVAVEIDALAADEHCRARGVIFDDEAEVLLFLGRLILVAVAVERCGF
jgi:hypothetical protein